MVHAVTLPVFAPSPVTLDPGQSRVMTVTINVPDVGSRGFTATTIVMANSTFSATHILKVTDVTLIPVARIYLPVVRK